MPDPERLEDLLEETLRRLGMPSPSVFAEITAQWAELAGEPWSSQSRPLYIKSRELVVEAAAPGLVAMLRYGVGELLRRLDQAYGEGLVDSVRVIPPGRYS
ncbi:MAG TPA: DUF721 domain-containing protein [Acidimicrobiia bacterium]|nr:DUF721 domain-containing protein [Acidimicrobiia bacterium]